MHVIPSPVYPPLQVHVKDPGVFVHMAFESQGDHSVTHSSISARVGLGCMNCVIKQMAQ